MKTLIILLSLFFAGCYYQPKEKNCCREYYYYLQRQKDATPEERIREMNRHYIEYHYCWWKQNGYILTPKNLEDNTYIEPVDKFYFQDWYNLQNEANPHNGGVLIIKESFINADGAWCWFSDPRVIKYEGIVYYGAVDDKGHIKIYTNEIEYDLGLLQKDDHNNPSFAVFNDKLYAFYSKHHLPEFYIAEFTGEDWIIEEKIWGGSVTYSHPSVIGDTLYLFYRGNRDTYLTKTVDMVNWTKSYKILDDLYIKTITFDDKIYIAGNDEHPDYTDKNYTALYVCNKGEVDTLCYLPVDLSWIWDIKISEDAILIGIVEFLKGKYKYRIYEIADGNIESDVETAEMPFLPLYSKQPHYAGGLAIKNLNEYWYVDNRKIYNQDNIYIADGIRPYYYDGRLFYLTGEYKNYTDYKMQISILTIGRWAR